MKSAPMAPRIAGGYVSTPNQPAIVLRPSRQTDSASSTPPVSSHSNA